MSCLLWLRKQKENTSKMALAELGCNWESLPPNVWILITLHIAPHPKSPFSSEGLDTYPLMNTDFKKSLITIMSTRNKFNLENPNINILLKIFCDCLFLSHCCKNLPITQKNFGLFNFLPEKTESNIFHWFHLELMVYIPLESTASRSQEIFSHASRQNWSYPTQKRIC